MISGPMPGKNIDIWRRILRNDRLQDRDSGVAKWDFESRSFRMIFRLHSLGGYGPKLLREIHFAHAHVAGLAGPHRSQYDELGGLVYRCVGPLVFSPECAHDSWHVLVGRSLMMALRPFGLGEQRLQGLPHGRV